MSRCKLIHGINFIWIYNIDYILKNLTIPRLERGTNCTSNNYANQLHHTVMLRIGRYPTTYVKPPTLFISQNGVRMVTQQHLPRE